VTQEPVGFTRLRLGPKGRTQRIRRSRILTGGSAKPNAMDSSSEADANPLGELDLLDADLGEVLTMAHELADALFRLVLENEDLLVFGLAQYFA